MFLQPLAIESILQPCSDKHQAGSDLRLDRSRFRPLRNQYNVARTGFRQLLQQPDASERDELNKTNCQNWESLSESLTEIVTRESKDLELLSWLCESQLFSSTPWQCLLTALNTLSRILELYWQDCHPGGLSEEERRNTPDIARRVTMLRTLFGEGGDSGLLVMPARLCPLIGSTTLGDCLTADRKGDSLTLKAQLTGVLVSEAETLKRRIQTLYDMRRVVKKIDGFLANHCEGNWIAGCQPLLDLLDTVIRWLDFICAEQVSDWPKDQLEQQSDKDIPVSGEPPVAAQKASVSENSKAHIPAEPKVAAWNYDVAPLSGNQSISTRMDAYRLLQQLADYFRHAEPHSPVTCLLDRALSWGQMPLEDLMKELLSGHQRALERVCDLTGLLTPVSRMPVAENSSTQQKQNSSSSLVQPLAPLVQGPSMPGSEDSPPAPTTDISDVGGAGYAEDAHETESTSGGFDQQLM